jgi:KUP system potassium uptake protein
MSGHGHGEPKTLKGVALASLGALGIVFGDIGTSPLYALRECFHGEHGIAMGPTNVLGVLSMIVWSLIVVVTVKYVAYVLRADNDGEGGILALLALALDPEQPLGRQRIVYVLGLFGAALLYGDGIITPAISVLSAVEGIRVEAPSLGPYVVPITVTILVALFLIQRRGTEQVGQLFGPVMLAWFVVLALLGIANILERPAVLAAVSPTYAIDYFAQNKLPGAIVLGSVFLVATGGEALYADMGHFGLRPIRLAWLWLALPALVLNYFGQGALLLESPEAIENPLVHMAPDWARIPVIVLATMATVIASQALITGTYSITRQATLLGYAPRLRVVHTSPDQIGQIYMPTVNWSLMIATIATVLAFGSSSRLAAAYGIAVTMTMIITTLLAYVVARRKWRWSMVVALGVTAPLLLIDLAFFGANAIKIADGGYVPVLVALGVFTAMTTWRRGREILAQRIRERSIPFADFPRWLDEQRPLRVPGTAVYLTAHPDSVPLSLVDNVRHNHAIHERVVLLSLVFRQTARVSIANRARVEDLGFGLVRIFGHYGFVETPNVPRLLELAIAEGIEIDPATVTFVVGRETLLATHRAGMAIWREVLFAWMSRNAQRAAAYFGIPSERVLEIGAQIEL